MEPTMIPFQLCTFRRPTRMFTLSVGPPLHSHSGVHAAPWACSHVPPPYPHHPSGPTAMFLFSTFTVRRPTRMFNPPTPTIPAGLQPCSHLGHSPSTGPLVCSHTLWAHRCIPTVVCMQLRGPACTFHPPPPPPSQQVCSYVSISDMYLLQAHSCAHTLSGPAAASPLYADSSVGPLVCSNPPPTPSRWAHSYVSISYMRLPQARLLNTFLPLFGHLGPHMYMKINDIQSPGPLQGDRIHHEIVKVG